MSRLVSSPDKDQCPQCGSPTDTWALPERGTNILAFEERCPSCPRPQDKYRDTIEAVAYALLWLCDRLAWECGWPETTVRSPQGVTITWRRTGPYSRSVFHAVGAAGRIA